MRIRFLSDQIYDQGGPGKGPQFPKGFVLDSSGVKEALGLKEEPAPKWVDGFLNRWLQRKVAEEVDDSVPTGAHPDPLDHDANGKKGGSKQSPNENLAVDLEALTRAELDALAVERGVDVSGAHTKADAIAALQKAEKVAAGDLEGLTRAELDALAAERGVDIADAKNKGDVIAALQLAAEAKA